mmetsp:Transcript_5038/g.12752  ORF Transcript_5038/g.12752 Transcript_5038/m.12752 type:complete len:208 (-) Transcript_5038:467-1090(-)
MDCIHEYGSLTRTTGSTLVLLTFFACLPVVFHFIDAKICFPHGTCQCIPLVLSLVLWGISQFFSRYIAKGFVPVLNIPAVPMYASCTGVFLLYSSQRSNPMITGPSFPPYIWVTSFHFGNEAITSTSIETPASLKIATRCSRPLIAFSYDISCVAFGSSNSSSISSLWKEVIGLYEALSSLSIGFADVLLNNDWLCGLYDSVGKTFG